MWPLAGAVRLLTNALCLESRRFGGFFRRKAQQIRAKALADRDFGGNL